MLEYYTKLDWKGLPGTKTLAYNAHSYVTKKFSVLNTVPTRLVKNGLGVIIFTRNRRGERSISSTHSINVFKLLFEPLVYSLW